MSLALLSVVCLLKWRPTFSSAKKRRTHINALSVGAEPRGRGGEERRREERRREGGDKRGGEERRGDGRRGDGRRRDDVLLRKRKSRFRETKASRRGGGSLFLEEKKTHFNK
ncbi:hypothetical protein N1851_005250 [Merluccius polli]|uniref:Uncharacterized protein n=1 Tax=Merluccius polli TaxID=89951 RepID=A0AA47P6R2_MERPO|nr:hypothetical protein N1851_005250 [Merluccius polli]